MKRVFIGILGLIVCSMSVLGQGSRERTTIVTTGKEELGCVPENAFGLDFGIGSKSFYMEEERYELGFTGIPTFDLGFRYLHHFSPYFGVDFFKFNNKIGIKSNVAVDLNGDKVKGKDSGTSYVGYNAQLMTGLRGNSPTFVGCMSGYGAFRAGYGVSFDFLSYDRSDDGNTFIGSGFCYELEIGLNITRSFFIAYAYNRQNGKTSEVDWEDENVSLRAGSHAFRIGFNFGK